MTRLQKLWKAGVLLFLTLASHGEVKAQQVIGITVSPATVRIPSGGTVKLTIAAVRNNGSKGPASDARFSSSDTSIASVDSLGRVLGKAPGIVVVNVTVDGLQRSVPVTVSGAGEMARRIQTRVPTSDTSRMLPRTQASVSPGAAPRKVRLIRLKPDSLRLLPTERATFKLEFEYEDGGLGATTGYTVAIYGAAASLDSASSTIVGLQPGAATLGVRVLDGPSISVPITVVPANIGFDRDSLILPVGRVDTVRVLTREAVPRRLSGLVWRSTNRQVLQPLDSSSGAVRATGVGPSDLIVDGYGVTLRLPVVAHMPIAALSRTGTDQSTFTLPVGLSARIGVNPVDASGNTMNSAPIRWEIGDSAIASYNAISQTLTGKRAGATTVTARAPGVAAVTWSFTVVDAQFRLDWRDRYLSPGSERHLQAHWIGPRGDTIRSTRALRWSSSDPSALTVSDSGVVKGLKQGLSKISAVFDATYRAEVDIPVTGDLLVTLEYGRDSIVTGDFTVAAKTFTALPPLATATDISWSSKRDRIAFVRQVPSSRTSGIGEYNTTSGEVRSARSVQSEQSIPLWMEDGARVAFVDGRSANTRLMFSALTDSQPRVLYSKARIQSVAKRPGRDEFYVVYEESKKYSVVRVTESDTTPRLIVERIVPIRQIQVLRDGTIYTMGDTSTSKERFAIARRVGEREDMVDIKIPTEVGQWRMFAVSGDGAMLFLVADNPQVRRGSILFRVDLSNNMATEILRTESSRVRAISP